MNMSVIDWGILIAVVAIIPIVAYSTKKYIKSVTDFLAANRCAGKYLLGVADGIAGQTAYVPVKCLGSAPRRHRPLDEPFPHQSPQAFKKFQGSVIG